ncbi:hypothetical protein C8T65DRAFT_740192 [Cerioporus squamosus]|nr:hypothetical protein C8T65DRAFT_740190 [Cerioporus squamosus]KAI0708175.1 hypothetical protein C8T65DRAFT_740192 [Cerioporus squamosus]
MSTATKPADSDAAHSAPLIEFLNTLPSPLTTTLVALSPSIARLRHALQILRWKAPWEECWRHKSRSAPRSSTSLTSTALHRAMARDRLIAFVAHPRLSALSLPAPQSASRIPAEVSHRRPTSATRRNLRCAPPLSSPHCTPVAALIQHRSSLDGRPSKRFYKLAPESSIALCSTHKFSRPCRYLSLINRSRSVPPPLTLPTVCRGVYYGMEVRLREPLHPEPLLCFEASSPQVPAHALAIPARSSSPSRRIVRPRLRV